MEEQKELPLPEEKLLTTGQLAGKLNMSTSVIYRWRKQGKIPSSKMGGTYFYSYRYICKWQYALMENSIKPRPEKD